MRIRDSGMPDETYWETLFDVPLTLSRFDIQQYRGVAKLGCGDGLPLGANSATVPEPATFTLTLATLCVAFRGRR